MKAMWFGNWHHNASKHRDLRLLITTVPIAGSWRLTAASGSSEICLWMWRSDQQGEVPHGIPTMIKHRGLLGQ